MGDQFILKHPAGLTAFTKKLAHTDSAVLENVCVKRGGTHLLQKSFSNSQKGDKIIQPR